MVVTFTNKAAGELQARLFSATKEAVQLATLRLAQHGLQVQLPVPEGPEQLGVLACTFHSWCYRVLRRYWQVSVLSPRGGGCVRARGGEGRGCMCAWQGFQAYRPKTEVPSS
jgi:superfamily I DNA/RNA helicase